MSRYIFRTSADILMAALSAFAFVIPSVATGQTTRPKSASAPASTRDGEPSSRKASVSSSQNLLPRAHTMNRIPSFFLNHPDLTKSALFASFLNTGIKTDIARFPWQVALKVAQTGKECGGVLVSPNYVLTAAHCVDVNYFDGVAAHQRRAVSAGSISMFQGGQQFATGSLLNADKDFPIFFHDLWGADSHPLSYDAALIRLSKPSNAIAAPVGRLVFATGVGVVSGWGAFDATNRVSPDLRAVRLPVVDNGTCRAKLAQVPEFADSIGDWALCTMSAKDDACVRDSGGPLVAGTAEHPQTIGIVSGGLSAGCAQTNGLGALVGIYTRGSSIAAWVERVTQGDGAVTSAMPGPTMSVFPLDDQLPSAIGAIK